MNGGTEMDVREKLVELLLQEDGVCEPSDCKYCGVKGSCGYYRIADSLIAHGVTVQEWISVDDMLPEEECRCLVIDAAGDIEIDCYDGKGRFVLDRIGAEQHPSHWMPFPKIPQPPKGE